jgi:hypothetical protein
MMVLLVKFTSNTLRNSTPCPSQQLHCQAMPIQCTSALCVQQSLAGSSPPTTPCQCSLCSESMHPHHPSAAAACVRTTTAAAGASSPGLTAQTAIYFIRKMQARGATNSSDVYCCAFVSRLPHAADMAANGWHEGLTDAQLQTNAAPAATQLHTSLAPACCAVPPFRINEASRLNKPPYRCSKLRGGYSVSACSCCCCCCSSSSTCNTTASMRARVTHTAIQMLQMLGYLKELFRG